MEDRLAYKVDEACAVIGLSRAELYRAIARGELRMVKFGRATRITRADLEDFLGRKRDETAHAAAVA